jgi:hypothetical protein
LPNSVAKPGAPRSELYGLIGTFLPNEYYRGRQGLPMGERARAGPAGGLTPEWGSK